MPNAKQITHALAATTKLTAQLDKAQAIADAGVTPAPVTPAKQARLVTILARAQAYAAKVAEILERLDARAESVEPSRRAEVGQIVKKNRRRKV